jgi:phosphatidate phosphatase APP1
MKHWILFSVALVAAVAVRGEEPLQDIVDDAWQGAQGYRISGRLTEIRPAPAKDSGRMAALYRNIRMLFTSGEEGLVTCRVEENEWSPRIDGHGYWVLAGSQPLNLAPGWHEIKTEPAASTQAGLLVADPRNALGIISDIDDSILISGVMSKRALLANSLTVPAEKREAVPGMAALYSHLLKENPAPESSAVFYVSSSPRQLTDNLRRFLQANGFPRGVLQLKGIASGSGDTFGEHKVYKLRRIETILAAFPQTRFHFFGDDAERDPEIYAEVQAKHPTRVAGVWIRRINPAAHRPVFPGQHDVRQLLDAVK